MLEKRVIDKNDGNALGSDRNVAEDDSV